MPSIRFPVVSSRDQALRTARGLISESFPVAADGSQFQPAAGTIYASLVGVTAGDVISKVGFHLTTAAVGTQPTSVTAGLATSAGVMVAVTAETKADAQWTAGNNTEVRFALGSAYTVPSNGAVYVVFLQVGSWGSTQLQLARSGAVQITTFAGALQQWGTAGTGKTGLPAVAASLDAIAAASTTLYAQLS